MLSSSGKLTCTGFTGGVTRMKQRSVTGWLVAQSGCCWAGSSAGNTTDYGSCSTTGSGSGRMILIAALST